MKQRKHTMLILSAVLCAACSEPDAADSVPAPGTARVTLRREGTAEVAAYAFRRRGDRFLFDTLFREGWSPEGTAVGAYAERTVQIPVRGRGGPAARAGTRSD